MMVKNNSVDDEPQFIKRLCKVSKSGDSDEKVEVLKQATVLLQDKKSGFSRNWPFINLCTSFLICNEQSDVLTLDQVEVAIVHIKFLLALVRSAPKRGVQQHSVVANLISNLFHTLYLARKDKTILNDPACDELEHRLKFLCQAASEDEELKKDLPFIIANNLRAERRPSIATLICVVSLSDEQKALLSTNLPTKEKQFFSQLMQRIDQN